jgi:hypothetical protein
MNLLTHSLIPYRIFSFFLSFFLSSVCSLYFPSGRLSERKQRKRKKKPREIGNETDLFMHFIVCPRTMIEKLSFFAFAPSTLPSFSPLSVSFHRMIFLQHFGRKWGRERSEYVLSIKFIGWIVDKCFIILRKASINHAHHSDLTSIYLFFLPLPLSVRFFCSIFWHLNLYFILNEKNSRFLFFDLNANARERFIDLINQVIVLR